jgi:hypothetical protein
MGKFILLLNLSLLIACTTQEKIVVPIDIVDGRPDQVSVDIATIPDAVPQYEPWSKSVNSMLMKRPTIINSHNHCLLVI